MIWIILIGSAVVAALLVSRVGRGVWQRAIGRRSPHFVSRKDLIIAVQDTGRERREGGSLDMSQDNLFNRLSRAFRRDQPREDIAPHVPAPALPKVEVDYEDERIPASAKDQVRRILACLSEVETALTRDSIPGFTGVDVIQLREEHLPRLIKSYIDIPESHRAEIFRKTGKSARYILNDSLDQMQKRIDAMLRSLAQKDIDTFTNNTRFVGERYSPQNPFD